MVDLNYFLSGSVKSAGGGISIFEGDFTSTPSNFIEPEGEALHFKSILHPKSSQKVTLDAKPK
jgi:hypothetical protein